MVAQYFEVQVYDQFAIRGNAAIFKCQVPSFVADHVDVVGWIDSNGGSYVTDGQSYGRQFGKMHVVPYSLLQIEGTQGDHRTRGNRLDHRAARFPAPSCYRYQYRVCAI